MTLQVALPDKPVQKLDYFSFVRREIAPLLPKNPRRILEVGAGTGGTLRWLKSQHPQAETTAVELNGALLDQLQKNVDRAIIGSIDETLPTLENYDLILLLDVLEHLPDATSTLKKLAKLLVAGGQTIVSVPNIAHLSVSAPLLLQRRFAYQDSGILDRTHLRFFVEATAVEMLNEAGLTVTAGLISGMQGPKARLLDRLSFGALRHHLAKQYIMRGELSDGKVAQQQVRWTIAR
jgi:2-polyprenyl-3-methyl-5-hydroxy-6-metoxy-1,4-benzoquinol methylase